MATNQTIFDMWGVTPEEYSDSVLLNPNHRALAFGYASEVRFQKFMREVDGVTSVVKQHDSNRSTPYDFLVRYRRHKVRVEVKSVRDKVRKHDDGTLLTYIKLAVTSSRNGGTYHRVEDEFDLLAINMFNVTGSFDFVYLLEEDWPRLEDKEGYLRTSLPISYPVKAPFILHPGLALERVIAKRK